ncbi:dioxygenase family protein [Lysobacter soyae]|uniref:Dioxygenase n=1 Tax=Lysobacter soyae TaxID=2764185 RepID=A0ABX8WR55_9GAMM|nr:class III extradiol ring-cleavage dioxygenase [Lysobacter sp. CJ11]QYR53314.1 dioxygenase [Lysobacter sp. CJ11]
MTRAPALFISHGSPMFALEPGVLGPNLQHIGAHFDAITAIVVVSPHWQTDGVKVGATAAPETVHDFGGFPPALYSLQYTPPGAPGLAEDIVAMLSTAGIEARLDHHRGLDHGAWVPLRHLRPSADLPVLQVSLPYDVTPARAYALGAALAPLRERGVLVIGSGSLTHNLYEFRAPIADPDYAKAFADWVGDAVARGDVAALIDYRARAPHATRAHPTEEHYLPLLVAVGASHPDDARSLIEGGMTYGVLSMDSFGFGLQDELMAQAA